MYLMFTKPNCPYCDKAKSLLNRKQIPYTWVDITEVTDMLDVVKSMGIKTVPAIFEFKGGFDQLNAELNGESDD